MFAIHGYICTDIYFTQVDTKVTLTCASHRLLHTVDIVQVTGECIVA